MGVESILKDHSRESRLFAKRATLAGVLALAAMLMVTARLAQLQIGNYVHLSTLSRDNQARHSSPSPHTGIDL